MSPTAGPGLPGIPLRARLRYRFDTLMARGAPGQILILALVAGLLLTVIVLVATVLHRVLDGTVTPGTVLGDIARTFMLILVPDPVDPADGAMPYLTGLLAIGAGLFVGGTLIGILSSAIDERMDRLRRGRSFVAEEGHTVILGWSGKIFRIVAELVIANENHPGRCVTVLAEGDPVEMERDLRERVGPLRGTRLVCRSGKPVLAADLALVNPAGARAIVVLSPEDRSEPDAHVVKILLTLARLVQGRSQPVSTVVELTDRRNQELCRVAVGDAPVALSGLVPELLLPRLLVQSCRKRGLSNVYLELFDFDGDEIYFHPVAEFPSLAGLTFGEALARFDDSTLLGLVQGGTVSVNPPLDTVLRADDEVIVISEDDDTTHVLAGPSPLPDESLIRPPDPRREAPRPERNLILGWNRYLTPVVGELDAYVPPGSTLTLASSYDGMEADLSRDCPNLTNTRVDFVRGSTTDRRFLDGLDLGSYDNVLILPTNPHRSKAFEELDAATITTLVHIRDLARRNAWDFSLTTQMLLDESREVADSAELGDFVVGDEILGRIMAQLAEEPRLKEVFRILLTVEGSELYLRPAEHYVAPGSPVDGYTLTEAARRRHEVYAGHVRGRTIAVNPRKRESVTLAEGDRVIVVAEH